MSAPCRDHPRTASAAACAGCAVAFCEDCLVSVSGRTFCGACKAVTVAGLPAPTAGTVPCKEADRALKLAIFGVFVLGPILEPIALLEVRQARRRGALDPRLRSDAKVMAATSLAIASLALWGINLLSLLLILVGVRTL